MAMTRAQLRRAAIIAKCKAAKDNHSNAAA